MNTTTETQVQSIKTKAKPNTDYIRIRRETKRKILSELANLNKKDFGRKITPDQYLSLAISLIKEEHRDYLRTESMSNQDRLEAKYREYCEANGKVSMDQFLGLLLKASS